MYACAVFVFLFVAAAGAVRFVSGTHRVAFQEHGAGGAVVNAQTAALLRPARHQNPAPGRGGGGIRVVGGAALAPASGPLGTGANTQERPRSASDRISLYIVREGDTLSQIAEIFGVSVNTIRWANDIKRDTAIQPGQTLLILPISGVRHTVQKGDTIAALAKRYGADAEEILAFNDLEEGAPLAVGTVLTIPGGEMPATKKRTPRPSSAVAFTPPAATRTLARGSLVHPLPSAVRTQGIHGYNAVDLAAPFGTPIVAAASGRVIVSRSGGWNGGYGTYVVIDHPDGTQTLYAHMSRVAVWQGAQVVAGQVIGYVGSTGRSTGPHVHFEVRGAINPF